MENKQQGIDSNAKIIGQIVGYLKNYPFLLMAVVVMLIMVTLLATEDVDKIKELKPFNYGLLFLAVMLCGLQFFFEFKKQLGRRAAGHALSGTLNKPAELHAAPVHFSRKAIASLALIGINILAFAGAQDKNAHLGAVILFGIPALILAFSALSDTRHGIVTGRGWAIGAALFSVLMILASLGGMSEGDKPKAAASQTAAPVNSSSQQETGQNAETAPPMPPVVEKTPVNPSYTPPVATRCVTQAGWCPMMVAIPVGSSCTCTNAYGVFPGLAQ